MELVLVDSWLEDICAEGMDDAVIPETLYEEIYSKISPEIKYSRPWKNFELL